jgi:hypothetical protein
MTASRLRWTVPLLVVAVLGIAAAAHETPGPDASHVIMYKGAQCDCCLRWGTHLTNGGFSLEVRIPEDLAAVFGEHAVPSDLASCHVALVDGYVIVGHVPIADVQRLLRERPDIAGIAVPGMPAGAPGMDFPGAETFHYDVIAFDREGATFVYARY